MFGGPKIHVFVPNSKVKSNAIGLWIQCFSMIVDSLYVPTLKRKMSRLVKAESGPTRVEQLLLL